MSDARVKLGRLGEELAARELTRLGYEIVARNWHCPAGEVDVVARRDQVWVFFEMRAARARVRHARRIAGAGQAAAHD